MYITRDRFGNKFPWEKKGKNKECEVKDKMCIIRKCFRPDNIGSADPKTQQKYIRGMCRGLYEGKCPENYTDPKNFITYKK